MRPAWLRAFELKNLFPATPGKAKQGRRQWLVETLDDRNMLSAAPVLDVNVGLKLTSTSPLVLTASDLHATDADTASADLEYTITVAPTKGDLKFNGGTKLIAGTGFTQFDINTGKISYTPIGTPEADTFSFTLSDSDVNTVCPNVLVNVNTAGTAANSQSFNPSISSDGRFVVFSSYATNLVANDTNGSADIFLRDLKLRTTTRISVGPGGVESNYHSFAPSISGDGKFVAYESIATNLVTGDTNNSTDVFVYNVATGVTTRESVSTAEAQANGSSMQPSLSSDGRYVVFLSGATTLVADDTNNQLDVFVRDRALGSTFRESVGAGGVQLNNQSTYASISASGRYVAFASTATNAVAGDTNVSQDVFVRDRAATTTTRVSVANGGGQANSVSDAPKISGDGNFIVYRSFANNLVAGDTNDQWDVFVTNRAATVTTRESVNSAEVQATVDPTQLSISDNGRYVTFQTLDSNLAVGDTNTFSDNFLRDRTAGTTIRASSDYYGSPTNGNSFGAKLSGDGRFVVFETAATDLFTRGVSPSGIAVFDTAFIRSKVTVTVGPLNSAPVLTAPIPTFVQLVDEDAGVPVGAVGTKVSNVIRSSGSTQNVTDANAGTQFGIAITSTDRAGFYSLNGGTTWTSMGTVSPSASLLLAADANTRIYFQPNADENGLTGIRSFTFRAWDRSTGAVGSKVSTSTNGGTTAFSSFVDKGFISVNPVNDAPVLNASKNVIMVPVEENADAPFGPVGTLVSSLVDFASVAGGVDNVTDADAGAKLGIAVAIVGYQLPAPATLVGYFSTNNGATWSLLGEPSDTSVRLLAADASTRIYFKPKADFPFLFLNGVMPFPDVITFFAWDQTFGTNGGTANINTVGIGGKTTFSDSFDGATIKVTKFANSAPVLDASKSPILNSVTKNAGPPSGAVGTLVSSLIDAANVAGGLNNVTDPDGRAKVRMVITAFDTTRFGFYYSKNNGQTWIAVTKIDTANSVLLYADASTRIFLRPKFNVTGTIANALTFKACDSESVANGSVVSSAVTGDAAGLSVASATAKITVI
jgi:hypothetical protein